MLLIPYGAKNPPERFPYATLSLVVANVLVYACTTESFLHVRENVLRALSLTQAPIDPARLLAAMFLHAEPLHLLGNMLFLWIFGAALEGRLGPWKYLAIYFASGLFGGMIHNAIMGIGGIGASGAIMGLAGAYLYVFPYAAIRVLFIYPRLILFGVRAMDWHARWVVLWFLGFDVMESLLFHGRDGVGHLCHLAGAAAGFGLVLALRVPRDDEEVSEVQRVRSETGGDYGTLQLHEMETLLRAETNAQNVPLILAYCWKALRRIEGDGHSLCVRALCEHARLLASEAEAKALGTIVQMLPLEAGRLPGPFLLRVGSRLESEGEMAMAARMYRRIYDQEESGEDTEAALFRLGHLTERTDTDRGRAASVYTEQIRLFPNGPLALDARSALARLGPPTIVFSSGQRIGAPLGGGWEAPPSPPSPISSSAQTPADIRPPARAMAVLADVPPLPAATEPAEPAEPGNTRQGRAYYVNNTQGLSLRPMGGDDGEKKAE